VVDARVPGLVGGGLTSADAMAVMPYRLISFGFTIGAGSLVWLLIQHRTVTADRERHGATDADSAA
jgi:hypothetical protein